MARTAAVLLLVALSSAIAVGASPAISEDKDQCETCKKLVEQTREELKEHAGDAKAFLLSACDSSPALFKDTCVTVAKSAGNTIENILKQAYETITEDKACAFVCKPEPGAEVLSEDPLHDAMQQSQRLVQEARAEMLAAAAALHASVSQQQEQVQGPLDAVCSSCKSMVNKARDWIKEHQTDVKDFMYKKCDEMTDVDPVKCKETADQVAGQVEATLESIYDSLDEAVVCSLFCPAPPASLLSRAAGSLRKFFNSQ